jgi:methionyl-tRNA synthetase
MQQLEQQRQAPAKATAETRKPPAAAAPPPVELAAGQNGEALPAGTGAKAGQRATEAVAGPAAASAAPVNPKPAAPEGKISIDDFAKVEMRVAQVKTAEKVKGADRLLRLEVDLGTEVRQIVAGIAEAYAPEQLVGRKIIIVANLAPRKLKGLESNGMLLAASIEGGKPVLAGFLEDVPVGAKLK